MRVGDHVYLITDPLQSGAGIPGMIYALEDSTVELVVESTHGPKILKVRNREDILPSNLYAHSILNLTTEEIVAKLIQRGLAPQTARRCTDILDEVEWHKARLPLRHWLESIRDFYDRSRLCTEVLVPTLRSVAPAAS